MYEAHYHFEKSLMSMMRC